MINISSVKYTFRTCKGKKIHFPKFNVTPVGVIMRGELIKNSFILRVKNASHCFSHK